MTLTKITSKSIKDNEIVNADLHSAAAIASTKLAKPIDLADNEKIRFGGGQDLEIFHDSNNSIINDNGTGELQIQRAGNTILTFNDQGIIINDPTGGAAVEIKGFEGGNASLKLIADEGDDSGDTWRIQSNATDNNFKIQNDTSGSLANIWQLNTSGDVHQTGHLKLPDSKQIRLGDDHDLIIEHNGSNSIINDAGTGTLILQSAGNDILSLTSAGVNITDPNGEAILQVTGFENNNAALQLVADEGDDNGDKWKLVSVNGANTLNFQNNTSGADVTKWKVDTAGNVTQTGDLTLPDNERVKFGEGTDMTIGHTSGVNTIAIASDLEIVHGTEKLAQFKDDGDVHFYSNNELRLTATTNGVQVERDDAGADVLFVVKNQNDHTNADAIVRLLTTHTSAHSIIQFGDSGDGDNGRIDYDHNNVDMTFAVNASNTYEMDAGAFHPLSTSKDLGRNTNSYRFDNVYCNDLSESSDKNEKNTIVGSDLGLDFINKLNPVSYKKNDGESGRTHYGLIAQEVETVISEIGKTTKEFAGFVKTTHTDDGKGNAVDSYDCYALRYTQFISPIIKAIQELSTKVAALEAA